MAIRSENASRTWRYIAAFVVFMGLLLVGEVLGAFTSPSSPRWLRESAYWIMPLQTIVCGGIIWRYRASYRLRAPRKWGVTIGIGIAVFLIWIAPQAFLGFAPRTDGFDVSEATAHPVAQGVLLALRLLRLVVVVPILEELFWRGFLLRYFVNDHFWKVAEGRTNLVGYLAVSVLFALAHSEADRVAAVITSLLYNWLFIHARSVSSCIVAHAVTNLLLGIYILVTRQWGFW